MNMRLHKHSDLGSALGNPLKGFSLLVNVLHARSPFRGAEGQTLTKICSEKHHRQRQQE